MKRNILAAVLLFLTSASCKDAQRWLSSYGFSALTPPTTLLQPGALIMKKRFSTSGTRLVCTAADSLGVNFVPSDSKTVTGKFNRSKRLGWHIGADVLSEIHIKAQDDSVRDVYVTVDNARVVSLSDTDVLRNVKNRSPECQAAIARRRASGAEISIISSALVADVSYSVKFANDANLDITAKLSQVQQVAVTLGGNIHKLTEDSASASQLIWGVQDSPYLAAIGMEDADVKSLSQIKELRRKSILSPNDVLVSSPNNRTLTPVLTRPSQQEQQYEVEDAPLWCPVAAPEDDFAGEPALSPETEVEPMEEPQPSSVYKRAGARSPPQYRGRPAVGSELH